MWEELKKKELVRAFEFCQTILKSPLTLEEFETVWYDEHNDKKGLNHLSNMCMSIFQARKASAGNSFEKYVELILTKANIQILKLTSNIWTFDEFISRMKQFQQTGSYSIA